MKVISGTAYIRLVFNCISKICISVSNCSNRLFDLVRYLYECLFLREAGQLMGRTAFECNKAREKCHRQRRLSTMLFQLCPPPELPACKSWWEACIYIGSTYYDGIFPALSLVFIIIPSPLWVATKTIFIDSGESNLWLMY